MATWLLLTKDNDKISLTKKLNASKIIDDYADYANISPTQIVPTVEVEKERQKEETQNAQKQAIESVKTGSEIIKNIAGADSYGADLMARLGLT